MAISSEAQGLLDTQVEEASLRHKVTAFAAEHQNHIFVIVLLGGTAAMFVDQALDAGVMVELVNWGWNIVAAILAMSIVVPQVIAWMFLKANGKASWVGLLRMLLFPSVGAGVLFFLWYADVHEPTLKTVAIFCIPASMETMNFLVRQLAAGEEADEAIWSHFAEGPPCPSWDWQGRARARRKWHGVSECGGRLYFCPL